MTSLPENIPFTISTSDPTASIRACEKIVIGQLGQTLDGCIATPTGDSKYINSDCGLKHLHKGRVDLNAKLFNDGIADVIIITSNEIEHPALGMAEIVKLPADDFHICPSQIVKELFSRGYQKILVEGGNQTLSNFMDAGVLDRLHLIVAPVIMGGGLSGLNLSPIDKLDEALRPEVTLYPLGRDVLFDCNLTKV